MNMAKYAAIPLLAILASCSSTPRTHVESKLTLGKHPSYQEKELKQDVKGTTEKSRDEQEKYIKEVVKALPPFDNKDGYKTRELELSTSDKSTSFKLSEESGWMPKEYVKMLNEARDNGYLLSYDFYEDGAVKDTNGNGKLDEGESKLSRPVVVIRKTDGTYCIGAYENADDGKLKSGLPVINVIKYNTKDSLGKAIQDTSGVARNYAKPADCGDGEIIRNPRVRIRTKEGIKEVVAAFALKIDDKMIIYFDKELELYLKDALPKYYRVLKE